MPRDCEAKGHGRCCYATRPPTHLDPLAAYMWCPGLVQPVWLPFMCAVQIFKVYFWFYTFLSYDNSSNHLH